MPQWKLFIIEMSGKMSEKILSRKWDVWQERLGWEGNSHLLGKMCPESVLGKDIQLTAGLSLSDVIRWWECPECVGQFCLTKDCICVTASVGPRRWHQARVRLRMMITNCLRARICEMNPCDWVRIDGFEQEMWAGDKWQETDHGQLIVCRVKRLYERANTWLMPLNIKIRPPADDKHLILGVVWCLFGQQMG